MVDMSDDREVSDSVHREKNSYTCRFSRRPRGGWGCAKRAALYLGTGPEVPMTGGCNSSWRTQPLAVTPDKRVVGKAQRAMDYCDRHLQED